MRATMANTVRYKPEVETLKQSLEREVNNLVTETDIDAISMAIAMFFLGGGVFHWFICQPHPTLPSC